MQVANLPCGYFLGKGVAGCIDDRQEPRGNLRPRIALEQRTCMVLYTHLISGQEF